MLRSSANSTEATYNVNNTLYNQRLQRDTMDVIHASILWLTRPIINKRTRCLTISMHLLSTPDHWWSISSYIPLLHTPTSRHSDRCLPEQCLMYAFTRTTRQLFTLSQWTCSLSHLLATWNSHHHLECVSASSTTGYHAKATRRLTSQGDWCWQVGSGQCYAWRITSSDYGFFSSLQCWWCGDLENRIVVDICQAWVHSQVPPSTQSLLSNEGQSLNMVNIHIHAVLAALLLCTIEKEVAKWSYIGRVYYSADGVFILLYLASIHIRIGLVILRVPLAHYSFHIVYPRPVCKGLKHRLDPQMGITGGLFL